LTTSTDYQPSIRSRPPPPTAYSTRGHDCHTCIQLACRIHYYLTCAHCDSCVPESPHMLLLRSIPTTIHSLSTFSRLTMRLPTRIQIILALAISRPYFTMYSSRLPYDASWTAKLLRRDVRKFIGTRRPSAHQQVKKAEVMNNRGVLSISNSLIWQPAPCRPSTHSTSS
jgi:hypothetical protein